MWLSLKVTYHHGTVLTVEILVWLASIRPLTRWAVWMYGDLRDSATCMLAGPQGMNWASFLSRIRCRLLWTWQWNKRYSVSRNSYLYICLWNISHQGIQLFFFLYNVPEVSPLKSFKIDVDMNFFFFFFFKWLDIFGIVSWKHTTVLFLIDINTDAKQHHLIIVRKVCYCSNNAW